MNTVSVKASGNYDVLIGSNLLSDLGRHARSLSRASRVCIVSDSNVWPLYGKTASDSLLSAGFEVVHFVFQAGEASKNLRTYGDLLNFLAENHITRSDLIVALGGGVTGDLAGFAAATYLRGIPYIQIPTTLLAAVDSSVGGKTAIDLPGGKNLAGAFYQPLLVLCDTDCLNTLPEEIFRDGCAEVIKYGILYDRQLFDELSNSGLDFDREKVITRCVELKRDVVAEDEFDTGARMRLNLGHTMGHAVESLSDFIISHGRAVAIGTAIIAAAGCAAGFCSSDTRDRILSVLGTFGLPLCCEYSAGELCAAALSDKKRSNNTISLIIPREIGLCSIEPIPVANLQSFIKAGL